MKKLIGSDIGQYVFNPVAGTITLSGIPAIKLEQLLVITNVTSGSMLYNFADSSLGAVVVENVINLEADTSLQGAGDALQVWIDLPIEKEDEQESRSLPTGYSIDTNLMQVFGSSPLVDGEGVQTSIAHKQRATQHAILGRANPEVRVDCTGMNTAGIQISGTWSGAVSFYGSVNGADFLPLNTATAGGGAYNSFIMAVVATGASGIFIANCAGLKYVLVRFTAATSGNPVVDISLTTARGGPMAPAQVYDASSGSSFGGSTLYTLAHTDALQLVSAPIINPTQPTSYADNKFARYPQQHRRLRVEIGGDQKVPLAQEQGTNRLVVSTPELYARIEELLMQQTLTNQLLAQAFKLQLPSGMDKSIQ